MIVLLPYFLDELNDVGRAENAKMWDAPREHDMQQSLAGEKAGGGGGEEGLEALRVCKEREHSKERTNWKVGKGDGA